MVRLYIEPAKKRAKAMKRAKSGPPVTDEESGVPTREEFIKAGVTMFGKCPEHWAQEYDRLVTDGEDSGGP